jgi:hypothetical protein
MGKQNVFVLGLDSFNLRLIRRLPMAAELNLHPLLSYEEIRGGRDFPVSELLARCEERLERFDGSIDAIVAWWDFPVTIMAAILCRRFGLPGADLESVLKCEHKYWSRLEQQKVIPDHIPKFAVFDPASDEPLSGVDLFYPFWIKPVKSFRSYLAYRINDESDILVYLDTIRENIDQLAEPFEDLLGHAVLPLEIAELPGRAFVAESELAGSQCTVEGYAWQGDIRVYGIVDSYRMRDASSLSRYQYPSQLPPEAQERMMALVQRVMTHLGFVHGPFNVEFFYDQTGDTLKVLEINPRQSQSHAYLFEKVHGATHHQVMLELALGREPTLPGASGPYSLAAKYMVRTPQDGFITRVPSPAEQDKVMKTVDSAALEILVRPGISLSQLPLQDSYSYELADLYLAGADEAELFEKYAQCLSMLPFRIAQERDVELF